MNSFILTRVIVNCCCHNFDWPCFLPFFSELMVYSCQTSPCNRLFCHTSELNCFFCPIILRYTIVFYCSISIVNSFFCRSPDCQNFFLSCFDHQIFFVNRLFNFFADKLLGVLRPSFVFFCKSQYFIWLFLFSEINWFSYFILRLHIVLDHSIAQCCVCHT